MEDVLWYFISIFILFLGVFVGKLLDVIFRCKIMRLITKREWGVLAIASPDNKQLTEIVVNFGGDVIKHRGRVWVIEQNKIFRMDKPERGFRLDREDLPKRWIDGIPYIFVSETSFLPIDITGTIGATRPEEVASVFLAWVNNQLAKGFASIKFQQTLLIVAVVLSLISSIMGYLAWQRAGDVAAQAAAIDARTAEWNAQGGFIKSPTTAQTNVRSATTTTRPGGT
jgi:hypothetical protein